MLIEEKVKQFSFMYRLFQAIVVGGTMLLTSSICSAAPYSWEQRSSTCSSCSPVKISAGFGILYWRPTGQGWVYALLNNTAPTNQFTEDGELLYLSPDYQTGFALWIGYQCNRCLGFSTQLLWKHYRSTVETYTRSPDSTDIDLVVYYARRGGGAPDFNYAVPRNHNAFDRVGWRLADFRMTKCASEIHLYGGLNYVRLAINRSVKAALNQAAAPVLYNFYFEKAKIEAGAFEVGAELKHDLPFHFQGVVDLSLLSCLGSLDHSYLTGGAGIGLDSVVTLIPDSTTFGFFGFTFRIGANFSLAGPCLGIAAEIGFQAEYYVDPIELNATSISNGNFENTCLGYGGPYLSVSLSY